MRVCAVAWAPTLAGRAAAAGAARHAARFGGVQGQGPCRLVSKNITVSVRNRALSDVLQPFRLARAELLEQTAAARIAAAAAAGAELPHLAGQWHAGRAEGQRKPVAARMALCGHRAMQFMGPDGELIETLEGCGQRACRHCAKRRANKRFKQIRNEVNQITEAQKALHRKPALLTFTVRRQWEDPAITAKLLRKAWTLFRARWYYHKEFAFVFGRFEEVACKGSSRGHVHWHTVTWLPDLTLCYSWLQTQWYGALRGAARSLGVELSADTPGNVDVRRIRGDAGTAYASKVYAYASKSAFDLEDMDPDAAASYLDATYGLRIFTCSKGYFRITPGGWTFLGFFTPGHDQANSAAEGGPQDFFHGSPPDD